MMPCTWHKKSRNSLVKHVAVMNLPYQRRLQSYAITTYKTWAPFQEKKKELPGTDKPMQRGCSASQAAGDWRRCFAIHINEFYRMNVCPHRRPSLVHMRAFLRVCPLLKEVWRIASAKIKHLVYIVTILTTKGPRFSFQEVPPETNLGTGWPLSGHDLGDSKKWEAMSNIRRCMAVSLLGSYLRGSETSLTNIKTLKKANGAFLRSIDREWESALKSFEF